jgi:electron transfer flavoprotein-quinone oxidoreductase
MRSGYLGRKMADDFDIIIIGAGIAGTACALRCARAGLSVLLLERGELPGSKNLSGGRLYCHALAELLPHFQQSAPLERRITQESLALLTDDGATMYSSLQPGGDSWSLLRARFDPWFVSQAEAEGVQCITGATVEALYRENGRVCGVICDNETCAPATWCWLKGRTASWPSVRVYFPVRPPPPWRWASKRSWRWSKKRWRIVSALGITKVPRCFSPAAFAEIYPAAHSSIPIRIRSHSVSFVRSRWEKGPSRPPNCWNISNHTRPCALCCAVVKRWNMAHLVPEGGLHSMPEQYAGEGWLLVGDALRTCINTGFTVRGMDMALIGAQAAAQTLIRACQQSAPQNCFHSIIRRLSAVCCGRFFSATGTYPRCCNAPAGIAVGRR